MSKDKNVTMCKSGCKDIPVHPDAVERFKEDGWKPADGSAPAAPVKEDSGMSEAEKQMEIDSAGEVARKKGVKAGLKGAPLASAVEAAQNKAAAALAE